MELTPVMQKYILHWGEMGSRWGVNRTVAQIHALLYLAPAPMHAEEITETLGVARSNVSTSLKELQAWGLVKVSHVMGDRRDRFQSLHDLWETFYVIIEERKRRELDPTLSTLRECMLEADQDKSTPDEVIKKIGNVLRFLEVLTKWYEQIRTIPHSALLKLLKMGSRITHFIGSK